MPPTTQRRASLRVHFAATTLLLTLALALAASTASAVDRNLAGSAQIDYHFVPTEGANAARGSAGQWDFDGFTIEATQKLAVDISDHLSTNVKICFGCHGFALDMAYFDYRVADEFNLRTGRFSPSFGSFNVRHDAANHKLSDQPLPYDMGHMLRLRTWNLGVMPAPFPDTGVEIDGTHWFGEDVQLDYAGYAIMGFKSNAVHPNDIDFSLSHDPYYTDNNDRPSFGGRLALTTKLGELSDLTIGGSAMYGWYDSQANFAYGIFGADVALRVNRTIFRAEYLLRRTEIDTSDPTLLALPVTNSSGRDVVLKHGAYAEFEQALSPSVDLVLRVDGLYHQGNFAASTTFVPLTNASWIARYTLGGSYAFEPAFRVKISTELWDFSDQDATGRTIDIGVHVAFVGTY